MCPTTSTADPSRTTGPVVAASVAAAVATALPGFLVGALSVQMRDEFGVAEARYGWAMSSYFLAATAGSVVLGRLAQRVGPRRQLLVGLLVAAVVNLAIATVAGTFFGLVALLAAAGFCNAGSQTAVNLALARARVPRLGLAIAIKQSGMPAASMLSGLAVPAIALTLGWRWAFAAVAVITVGAAIAVMRGLRHLPAPAPGHIGGRTRTGSPTAALVGAAVASAFLAFGAGTLNAWVVESGVDAGLDEGVAGLMLSVGAALGIAIRLAWGLRLDDLSLLPFRVAGVMALGGAIGIALLAGRAPAIHVVATVLAFAGGWIWPVFTNFGVVRANEGHAAAATGVSQTGVYIGVFAAPLVTGTLIEHAGFPTMWWVTAAAMAIGATVAIRIADRF
jgi:predicted MFS family arabinose efflux permease